MSSFASLPSHDDPDDYPAITQAELDRAAFRVGLRPTECKQFTHASHGILDAEEKASPMDTKTLPELVQQLPPDAQEVVRELVELLLARPKVEATPQPPHFLRQDWAGALRAYRDEYTSVELQHQALEWRSVP